jgi:hypothetical protein
MFETRVLRRRFEPKRNDVIGDCKILHNELNNLHFSPHIIRIVKSRMMRQTGYAAHMGQKRSAHKVLVGTPKGKGLLRRPMQRWEADITIILKN